MRRTVGRPHSLRKEESRERTSVQKEEREQIFKQLPCYCCSILCSTQLIGRTRPNDIIKYIYFIFLLSTFIPILTNNINDILKYLISSSRSNYIHTYRLLGRPRTPCMHTPQSLPGKMLMSMTVRVCVWMLTMTSTPNSAMPSSALRCSTSATMASLLGGGRRGMLSSSCQEETRGVH